MEIYFYIALCFSFLFYSCTSVDKEIRPECTIEKIAYQSFETSYNLENHFYKGYVVFENYVTLGFDTIYTDFENLQFDGLTLFVYANGDVNVFVNYKYRDADVWGGLRNPMFSFHGDSIIGVGFGGIHMYYAPYYKNIVDSSLVTNSELFDLKLDRYYDECIKTNLCLQLEDKITSTDSLFVRSVFGDADFILNNRGDSIFLSESILYSGFVEYECNSVTIFKSICGKNKERIANNIGEEYEFTY